MLVIFPFEETVYLDAGVPVTNKFVEGGAWEVDIAGRRVGARVVLKPLYDPANARIKA